MSGDRRLWLAPVMPILMIAGVALAWYASDSLFRGPTKDGERLHFYWIDAEEAAKVDNPHELPLCQSCHLWGDVRLAANPSETCAACHDAPHPIHAVGLMPLGDGELPLPLGYHGEVACHSCHESHDLNDAPYGLRMPQEALCVACHEERERAEASEGSPTEAQPAE